LLDQGYLSFKYFIYIPDFRPIKVGINTQGERRHVMIVERSQKKERLADCDRIFEEKASGKRGTTRPALNETKRAICFSKCGSYWL
jgi:hypothetical protein